MAVERDSENTYSVWIGPTILGKVDFDDQGDVVDFWSRDWEALQHWHGVDQVIAAAFEHWWNDRHEEKISVREWDFGAPL